jgi:hypothetical protein
MVKSDMVNFDDFDYSLRELTQQCIDYIHKNTNLLLNKIKNTVHDRQEQNYCCLTIRVLSINMNISVLRELVQYIIYERNNPNSNKAYIDVFSIELILDDLIDIISEINLLKINNITFNNINDPKYKYIIYSIKGSEYEEKRNGDFYYTGNRVKCTFLCKYTGSLSSEGIFQLIMYVTDKPLLSDILSDKELLKVLEIVVDVKLRYIGLGTTLISNLIWDFKKLYKHDIFSEKDCYLKYEDRSVSVSLNDWFYGIIIPYLKSQTKRDNNVSSDLVILLHYLNNKVCWKIIQDLEQGKETRLPESYFYSSLAEINKILQNINNKKRLKQQNKRKKFTPEVEKKLEANCYKNQVDQLKQLLPIIVKKSY